MTGRRRDPGPPSEWLFWCVIAGCLLTIGAAVFTAGAQWARTQGTPHQDLSRHDEARACRHVGTRPGRVPELRKKPPSDLRISRHRTNRHPRG